MHDPAAPMFARIRNEIARVIVGQEEMIELMILALFARGHVLLEGVPGLAKSLAVETFARAVGGEFKRFQFTPDKMPGDITGTMVFNPHTRSFDYHRGPVFCNIFLADEINRASPKVQSALLQAMQERRVDAERETFPLPDPFMVLATENPVEQAGTYPLAEAQVDRFMVKVDVGYPAKGEEADLLRRKNADFEARKAAVAAVASPAELRALQDRIHDGVRVSRTVMDYILTIVTATRPDGASPAVPDAVRENVRLGASPRAAEFMLALVKARAFSRGRGF
uniref:AAA family ATPase n=1 Tax=Desulfococcus sp. TaxID=2025834 RepID=UPI003593AD04